MTREEAVKILREAHDNALFSVRTALETLIPELKESDDERMLQTIIRGFENCKRNGMETFNNTKIDDILVYLEKQKEIGIQWLKSDNVKNPDKPYIDKAGMFYTTDGRMCYASEIEKRKEQKSVECIDFDNEFENQVSHLLASVLNGEHKYNRDFVKYASQSLLGYAKNELKSDELNEREKLMKALQTTNAQIGELVEENYKLKEQKPVEINEYEIIKKHITEDFLSSEVNKRLKECGWYVTDEKPAEWNLSQLKMFDDILVAIELDKAFTPKRVKELVNLINTCRLHKYSTEPTDWSEEDEENIQTRFAFYTYKDDPCTLYLSNIFVEETSRNKGFGTKILTAAEKVAETFGVTYIRLKVKQGSSANAWYRKNGYGYVAFEDGYDWLEKNLEYMKSSKLEWSKEDEIRLKEALGVLSESIKHLPIGYGFVEDVRLVKDWLKLLPGRFNLQLKQEWSEEDERKYQCIRNILLTDMDKKVGSWKYSEILEWYEKRGIGRYTNSKLHWKPNEEQMEALKNSAYGTYQNGDGPVLRGLYEQLEKL